MTNFYPRLEGIVSPISQEEVIKIYEKGFLTKEERERLILSCIKLVPFLLNKFGLSKSSIFKDLYSEGLIGVIRGIDKYNVNKKTKLSFYVSLWIIQKIKKFLANERTIRFSYGVSTKMCKIRKEVLRELQTGDIEYSNMIPNISKKTDVEEKEIKSLLETYHNTSCFPIEDTPSILQQDINYIEKIKRVHDNKICQNILKIMEESFSKRDLELFRMHIIEERTLEEIGESLSPPICRERVRQIIATILRKLRKHPKIRSIGRELKA